MGGRIVKGLAFAALVAAVATGCSAPRPVSSTRPINGTIVSVHPVPGVPRGTGSDERVLSMVYWSRGIRVQAYVDLPPKVEPGPFPLYIFLHGGYIEPTKRFYGQSIGGWTAASAASMASADYAALFVNYAGYGPSRGAVGDPYDNAIDTQNALDALQNIPDTHLAPHKIYVWGGSMGGTVAMLWAERHPQDVRAVVLESPYPGDLTTLAYVSGSPTAKFHSSAVMDIQSLQARYGSPKKNPGPYRRNSVDFARLKGIPILVIGGQDDATVPKPLLIYMFGLLKKADPRARLTYVPGPHVPLTPKAFGAMNAFLARHGFP